MGWYSWKPAVLLCMESGTTPRDTAPVMSKQNLEIVQRIYAGYADDPDSVRDAYASDFEFDVAETGPDIGIVAGFDAATEAMRPYFDSFDDFRMEIDEVLHADDRNLVVAMHDTGRMPRK